MHRRILIAPDSFKGSSPAFLVATAIAEGWRSVALDDELLLLPQADGGEGTCEAMAAAIPGSEWISAGQVTGPDGHPIEGRWLRTPDATAVVELAQMSGLPLMAGPDPLGATTRGLGEVIAHAVDSGVTRLVIGLGGSASTDGAAGALRALGLEVFDTDGFPLAEGGAALVNLARIDSSGLRNLPPITLLSDVTATLLEAPGVFGPQKGALPPDVAVLEHALEQWSRLLGGEPGTPGAGAAGGTGYGFLAAYGAHLESGSVAIAALTGFTAAAASANLIITGEGRFDATSLEGKVVGHALSLGRPTIVIAGQVAEGFEGISLTTLAGSAEASMADPLRWLRKAGALAASRSLA